VFLLPAVTTPRNVLTLLTTQLIQVNMAAEKLVQSAPLHYACSEDTFECFNCCALPLRVCLNSYWLLPLDDSYRFSTAHQVRGKKS